MLMSVGPGRTLTPMRGKKSPRRLQTLYIGHRPVSRVFDRQWSSSSAPCRTLPRRDGKHLEDDLRVKGAKLRLSERSRKLREEQGPEVDRKRRKLDDIEDVVINEGDPQRLATLYEQFQEEYELYLKAEMDASDTKRRKFDNVEVEMMKTGDPKRVRTSCEEHSQNNKRQKGEHQMQEVATSSTEDAVYQEVKIDQVLEQEWIDKEKGA